MQYMVCREHKVSWQVFEPEVSEEGCVGLTRPGGCPHRLKNAKRESLAHGIELLRVYPNGRSLKKQGSQAFGVQIFSLFGWGFRSTAPGVVMPNHPRNSRCRGMRLSS